MSRAGRHALARVEVDGQVIINSEAKPYIVILVYLITESTVCVMRQPLLETVSI